MSENNRHCFHCLIDYTADLFIYIINLLVKKH